MTDRGSLPGSSEETRALQDTFQVVRRLVLDLLAASQESQVLAAVAEQVRLLLGASASCVLLAAPRPAPGTLELAAWDGLPEALRQECGLLKEQARAEGLSQGARALWEAARRAMLQGSVVQGREAPPGFAALVATPLKRRKEAIGVLALLFREPRPLDRTDVYVLESSAALATAVLDNVVLLRQERERRLQAALLLEVTQAATSSLALGEVLQQVAEKTARLAQADRCSIWLLNDAGDTLLPAALSGMDQAFVQEWLKHPLRLDQEPLSRQALETGKPVVVQDALTDPRTDKDAVRLFGDRSIVVFPLLGRQRRLGTLFLNWVREQKVLSEAELELTQAVAAQATVAIEYAWMHAQTEARLQETRAAYRQLRALQETTALLTTTLDLQEVLERIVWGVVNGLGYNIAALGVLEEGGRALRVRAMAAAPHLEEAAEALLGGAPEVLRLSLDEVQNLAVQAILSGGVLLTHTLADLAAPFLPRETGDALQKAAQVQTMAVIPLLVHGQRVGALLAGSPHPEISPRELEVLQTFSSQAAMAIHNASLHQQVAESERRFRDVVEHASDAILHLDARLELCFVNRKAEDLLGRPREALLGERATTLVAPQDRRRLSRRLVRLLEGGELPAPFEVHLLDAQRQPIPVELSLARVVTPDRGPVVEVIARDIRDRKRLEQERAALLAETRRRSRQLQLAFHQLGLALASMPHLEQTLQAIVDLARALLEADWCTLHDCSEAGEAGAPVCLGAASGEIPLRLHDEPIAAWTQEVLLAGKPLQVPERNLTSPLAVQGEGNGSEGVLLGVPLVLQDEPVGVLTLRRAKPARFSQEEVALVSGFAHMAALAIERARLFASVLQEKQEVEAVIRHTADGILLIGPDGRILDVNPALEDLLGMSRADLVGTPCAEILCRRGPDAPRECPLFKMEGEVTHAYQEHTLWSPSGRKIPVGVSYGYIRDETGALVRLVAVIRDISRQRELDRLRSDFVSAVSHELRTPLSLIKGYAGTLLREDLTLPPETQRRFLAQIDAAANRLQRLINDLFTVSRLEAGRLELQPQVTDVAALVRKVAEGVQQVADQRIQVRLPLMPLQARLDPDRIAQVLDNLLGNAIKFSPPEGTITVSAALEGEGDWVHLWVEDEGPGIPPQHLERIFEKFYRVERGMVRKASGVGLGLHICKSIVEAHGGKIWAENRPEGGSAFHVRLPVAGPPKEPAAPAQA